MSEYNSVKLQLNRYKWEALERVLEEQGTDIETVMQEHLIELYSDHVPVAEQMNIRQRLDAEVLDQQKRHGTREVVSGKRLNENDISFSDEIMREMGALNFYINTDFSVDTVFGTNVETVENDDWLNVYASFDTVFREVCNTLDIVLHHGDGGEESLSYMLNDAEKEILYAKMDEYCQQQNGKSLEEYCDELLQEQCTGLMITMG